MPRFRPALLALLGAALVTPAFAGVLYVPALNETDGSFVRSTQLLVTNPSDVDVLGFFAYFIPTLWDGTVRGTEPPPVYYVAPGQSVTFNDLVPAGQRGLLELEASPGLVVSARLKTSLIGFAIEPEPAEVPVVTSKLAAAAGSSAWLQDFEKFGSDRYSNLGAVNLSHTAANCTVDVRRGDGLLMVQNVAFQLPPLTLAQFDDAFSLLGLTTVPKGARVRIGCDQTFWAYTSLYDERTGAGQFVGPSATPEDSAFTKPAADDGGGGGGGGGGGDVDPTAVVFELPGEFLRSTPDNTNWRFDMPFGGQRSFRRIVLDFDLYVSGFDPHNGSGFHCLFWFNNGSAWDNMLGYVNSRGNQNRTVFQVNATGGGWIERVQTPGVQPGNNYHVHYEYDTDEDYVAYSIRQGGSERVGTAYDIRVGPVSTNRTFIEFGTQVADEGPEASTYGWRFSNFVAQFIP